MAIWTGTDEDRPSGRFVRNLALSLSGGALLTVLGAGAARHRTAAPQAPRPTAPVRRTPVMRPRSATGRARPRPRPPARRARWAASRSSTRPRPVGNVGVAIANTGGNVARGNTSTTPRRPPDAVHGLGPATNSGTAANASQRHRHDLHGRRVGGRQPVDDCHRPDAAPRTARWAASSIVSQGALVAEQRRRAGQHRRQLGHRQRVRATPPGSSRMRSRGPAWRPTAAPRSRLRRPRHDLHRQRVRYGQPRTRRSRSPQRLDRGRPRRRLCPHPPGCAGDQRRHRPRALRRQRRYGQHVRQRGRHGRPGERSALPPAAGPDRGRLEPRRGLGVVRRLRAHPYRRRHLRRQRVAHRRRTAPGRHARRRRVAGPAGCGRRQPRRRVRRNRRQHGHRERGRQRCRGLPGCVVHTGDRHRRRQQLRPGGDRIRRLCVDQHRRGLRGGQPLGHRGGPARRDQRWSAEPADPGGPRAEPRCRPGLERRQPRTGNTSENDAVVDQGIIGSEDLGGNLSVSSNVGEASSSSGGSASISTGDAGGSATTPGPASTRPSIPPASWSTRRSVW